MLESLLVSYLAACLIFRFSYLAPGYTDIYIKQIEEGKKGSESNVEHITAAKEAIAKAKTAEREIS